MKRPSIKTVAVIGTGVIGRSWIQVYARAGCTVRVFDANPDQLQLAMDWFARDLKDLRNRGEIKKKEARARLERVTVAASIKEAVEGAGYVQESGPEDVALKRAMYLEIDPYLDPKAIVGSSTSALDMTEITQGVPGADRYIVAHPVNPPHVVPVVEVLGGAATDPKVVKRTVKFLREVGQTPVRMKRYAAGFIMNRMQAALVREAVDLVASGVCDVEAVDDCIRDGLGLRWALMGPFGVANTNADGGVAEYFTRFRGAYHGLWDALSTTVRFDDELVKRLAKQTNRMAPMRRGAQRAWRDRMVGKIRRLKAEDPLVSKGRRVKAPHHADSKTTT